MYWKPPERGGEEEVKMSFILARKVRISLILAVICFSVSICLTGNMPKFQTAAAQNRDASAKLATAKIVKAANAFLSTLTLQQRKSAQFVFSDEQQRARWSNLPTSFSSRAGVSMGELNATQRTAAMTLLSSTLSKKGYEKVQQIVDGDEALKTNEGNSMFGKDLFYISFLGTPSEKDPWMLQFGGHHLALNITIIGERGILTPSLTGAQPALLLIHGKTVRPLGQESDKAVTLLNAVDEKQRKSAILNYQVGDLVLGPGQDGKTIVPEGLKGSAMNEKQRAMMLDLISEWTGIMHDSAAEARMTEIKAGINDTWFAWSGPTTVQTGRNISSYYRIQGPKLVIEYSPQRLGGDLSNHIHTIYRDPTNDYGRARAAK